MPNAPSKCYLCRPSKKGRHIDLLLSVSLSVGRSVGRCTNSFLFISSQKIIIFQWNLVYRLIMVIPVSRSTLILGTIEKFSTEFCHMEVKQNPVICSFNRRGISVTQTSLVSISFLFFVANMTKERIRVGAFNHYDWDK